MGWTAFTAPSLVGAASIALSVWVALPLPVPDRPATILLFPGQQQGVLAALVDLDPELRLLDSRADGLVMTVEYSRADLPEKLAGTGIIAVVGTGTIGCVY